MKKLTGEQIKRDGRRMITERSGTWDSLYNDVRHWYAPDAADFNTGKGESEGQLHNRHIFNPIGRLCAERLANIYYSTVFPVHTSPFSLTPPLSDNDAMKTWWQKASEKNGQKMAESDLPNVMVEALRTMVYFGTPAIYTYYEDGRLQFSLLNPENTFIKLDYNRKPFVVMSRRFETAENLIRKFGSSKVSNKVREMDDGKRGSKEVEIYHYFYRDDSDRKEGEDGKWFLYVVETKTGHLIDYYSFSSQPVHLIRSNVSHWETYSRSPSMEALDTVIDVNMMEKTIRRQAEKHVDPPLGMPYDATMSAVSLAWDTGPGGIVEVMPDPAGGINMPTPLMLGGDLSVGEYQVDKAEQFVREIFMLDILTAILEADEQATATQIDGMTSEKLDLVVPIVVSLINSIKPIIARCFKLLLDKGDIDLPPGFNEDQALDFEIEVQSSLLIKLKQIRINSSLSTVSVLGNLAQFDPQVLDPIDFKALAREVVASSSMPTSAIRSPEDEQKHRQQLNEQAAQAQANQQAGDAMAAMAGKIDPNQVPQEGSITGELTGALRGL